MKTASEILSSHLWPQDLLSLDTIYPLHPLLIGHEGLNPGPSNNLYEYQHWWHMLSIFQLFSGCISALARDQVDGLESLKPLEHLQFEVERWILILPY